MGLRKQDPHEIQQMKTLRECLRIGACAALIVAALDAIIALPGFLADGDSTVSIRITDEEHQHLRR
jgi:hypothetical protein